MEAIMWLIISVREQLWGTVANAAMEPINPRQQATLDIIHVLNDIIMWAERSHYGDSGEMLPVVSMDRQGFYDVLTNFMNHSMAALRAWDDADTDKVRGMLHTNAIGLDTVATRVLQPYYVSRIHELMMLTPVGKEYENDGTGDRSTVANDGGQRGHDSTGD